MKPNRNISTIKYAIFLLESCGMLRQDLPREIVTSAIDAREEFEKFVLRFDELQEKNIEQESEISRLEKILAQKGL